MRDFLGREIQVGDYLIHASRYGSSLTLGVRKVLKINRKTRQVVQWVVSNENRGRNLVQEDYDTLTVVGPYRWKSDELGNKGTITTGDYCVVIPADLVPAQDLMLLDPIPVEY